MYINLISMIDPSITKQMTSKAVDNLTESFYNNITSDIMALSAKANPLLDIRRSDQTIGQDSADDLNLQFRFQQALANVHEKNMSKMELEHELTSRQLYGGMLEDHCRDVQLQTTVVPRNFNFYAPLLSNLRQTQLGVVDSIALLKETSGFDVPPGVVFSMLLNVRMSIDAETQILDASLIELDQLRTELKAQLEFIPTQTSLQYLDDVETYLNDILTNIQKDQNRLEAVSNRIATSI